VDLSNPEKVKEYIATFERSDDYKDNLIDANSHYTFFGIKWIKPTYVREATKQPSLKNKRKYLMQHKM
jgi:hypothetical protein